MLDGYGKRNCQDTKYMDFIQMTKAGYHWEDASISATIPDNSNFTDGH